MPTDLRTLATPLETLDVPGPHTEADLAFVAWVLSGIEDRGTRARWVRQNLPRTASLLGIEFGEVG